MSNNNNNNIDTKQQRKEKEQDELRDLCIYNKVDTNTKTFIPGLIEDADYKLGKEDYDNKLIDDGIKTSKGVFKHKPNVCLGRFKDEDLRDIILYSNKNETINRQIKEDKNDSLLFNTDVIRTIKEDELKALKSYCNIKYKRLNKILQKNYFLNECVGLYTNLYYDIEYPKSKQEENPNIMTDFCEAIEKDFLDIFGFDISKLRIVLYGGYKEKKEEYSYHVIYKISEINLTFKYNHNQRIFTYIGNKFNAFKEKNGINLSFSSGNNFLDFVIYDKERFVRCINQSKIKDVNNKSRHLRLHELSTYTVKKMSDTLINTTVFHTPCLYKQYDTLEGYEILDEKLNKFSYKKMKDDINGIVNGKYPWMHKDLNIVKREKIVIKETKDFLKYLLPHHFVYNKLINLMWSYKGIGGKITEFQDFVKSYYDGDIKDYWNGFKLNEKRHTTYNIIVDRNYQDIEDYLIRNLKEYVCVNLEDKRFEQFFQINEKDASLNIIKDNTSVVVDGTVYVSDYCRCFIDESLTKDKSEKVKTNLVIVKAPLGSGKSKQYIDCFKHKYNTKKSNKKSLIITPRRTFTQDLEKRLNNEKLKVWSYLDCKKRVITKTLGDFNQNLENNDIFLISLESLKTYFYNWEKEDLQEHFDFVVCDEIETIYSSFVKGNLLEDVIVIRTFKMIVQNIKNVLFLDGMISKKTIDLINSFRPKEKKTLFIDNKIDESIKRDFVFMGNTGNLYSSFFLEVQELVLQNKKIFCYFNVKKHLNTFHKDLTLYFNKIKPLNILKYTGDLDDKETVKDIKSEDWGNYDIILSTSTLSCGVDFNQRDVFDKSLCFISGNGCGMGDIIQGLLRIRRFKDNKVSLYVNKKADEEDFNYKKERKEYSLCVLSNYDFNTIKDASEISPEDFIKEIKTNQKIETYFKNHKTISTLKYLINQSCNTYSGDFTGRDSCCKVKTIEKLYEKLYDMKGFYNLIEDIEDEEEYMKTIEILKKLKESIKRDEVSDIYYSKINFSRLLYERIGKYIIQKKLEEEKIDIDDNLIYNWEEYYSYKSLSYKMRLEEDFTTGNENIYSYAFYNNNNITLEEKASEKYEMFDILKNNFDKVIKKHLLDKNEELKEVDFFKMYDVLKRHTTKGPYGRVSSLNMILKNLNIPNKRKRAKQIIVKLLKTYYGKTYITQNMSPSGYVPSFNMRKSTKKDIQDFLSKKEGQEDIEEDKNKLYVGDYYNLKDFSDFDFKKVENIFKIHTCENCCKSFNNKSSYKEHKEICEGIDFHTCRKCNKDFSKISFLSLHNKTCNPIYTCTPCNKTFKTKNNFDKHNNTKNHKNINHDKHCTICDKTCKTFTLYERHMNSHTNKHCTICDKSFPTKSKYERHMNSKTHKKVEEKTEETNKHCTICDKSFSSVSSYNKHMNSKTHKIEKDFVELSKVYLEIKTNKKVEEKTKNHCAFCNKTFSSVSSYNKHMKSKKHQ